MSTAACDNFRRSIGRVARLLAALSLCWLPVCAFGHPESRLDGGPRVPILLYHRFAALVTNPMTVTPSTFAAQLHYLKSHGYAVIPLEELVAYRLGKGPPPGKCSVVLAADDDHRSVYAEMFPLVRRYQVPVTLFIYPSAISNASYGMTWEQLREMKDSRLVDVQSQTYWHPNFKQERRRRSPADYEQFVKMQLVRSKQALEQRLGGTVDMLSWPFGIYDDELIRLARQAGYVAGFTLERRPVAESDNPMAMPRYIVTEGLGVDGFARLLAGTGACAGGTVARQ
jgi:peptidoglycan/xylan/chitin deacetylase (PgdA/CDA1 family)